jgi:crotonobetainyl-CoA:carnitine CoA-transferase CaiB-like acyl-CoA transferase
MGSPVRRGGLRDGQADVVGGLSLGGEQGQDQGQDVVPWGREDGLHEGPLAGLRVIDAGTMIAGPFAATLLGDYGADVIKIEKPKLGDPMRDWAPMKDGLSLWWKVTARNKRLITLDLSKPRGREVFLALAALADVVVENFRPGTLERWGLGFDTLKAQNPGLVLVRVSGYGQTGPYSQRPGYGTVADAFSGIPAFTGFPDRPPTLPAFPLADTLAGSFGVIGALAALHENKNSGKGDVVDVSLFEPLFRLVESQAIAYDQLGLVKSRVGNRLEEDSPRNAYPTSDGEWIALSASSHRTFERLAQAIGKPELPGDPRFASNPYRIANADALDAIVGDWILGRRADEVLRIFNEHDVVVGRIYDIEDIFDDPHYASRGAIAEVEDGDFGTVRMPGVVPSFERSTCRLRRSGGALGEDNDFVYRRILGFADDELDRLRAEDAI